MQSYLAGFEAFTNDGGKTAPQWARSLRLSAITRFEELGFPTTKNEDWHFTSVAPIAEREFEPLVGRGVSTGVSRADLAPFTFGGDDWHTLVFVNGRFNAELSGAASLPDGVSVMPIARAYDELPLLLEQHLGRIASIDAHTFTALNTAFINDGAVVHVGKDVELDKPIHLLFVSDESARNGVAQPRNLIVLDRFAKATVIESYAGLRGATAYFTNAVTEAVVAASGRLDHYKLQRESEKAFHVAAMQIHQERNSVVSDNSLSFGGALVRNDVNQWFAGEGAELEMDGLYATHGTQHMDTHTRIDHAKPHCTSRELYKGILDGQSRGIFCGNIVVHPDAQKTDAVQTNKNLLLSREALADSIPGLQILANDVKCKHGSSTGQLDEGAVFYLRSRGLDTEAARAMLTYAFVREIVDRVRVAAMHAVLSIQLASRLPQADVVREVL